MTHVIKKVSFIIVINLDNYPSSSLDLAVSSDSVDAMNKRKLKLCPLTITTVSATGETLSKTFKRAVKEKNLEQVTYPHSMPVNMNLMMMTTIMMMNIWL